MRRMTVLLIAIAAGLTLYSQPAICTATWCPTFACFNQYACGAGCTCITPPGQIGGECWGLNVAEALEKEGWTRP